MATQALEDHIADVSQESLIFKGAKRGLITQVAENVADAKLEETMKGASDLSVEVRDHGYELLNSGLFDTRFFCAVDGANYRYTEVSLVSQYLLRISFEHALIAEMREHTGNVTAVRGKVTRAEFIYSMLKELKLPFRFICPELHKAQRTPAPEKFKESQEVTTGGQSATSNLADVGRGPALDSKGLTVKGAALTAAQAKILVEALAGAETQNAPTLSMEAMVVSLIQENDVSLSKPGNSGDRGAFSMIDSTVAGIQKQDGSGHIDPYSTGEVAEHYVTAGFAGAGGSNALARKEPSAAPNVIASKVEGPAATYPSSWNGEAKKIVAAFLSGGLSLAGGGISGLAGLVAPEGTTTVESVRTATFEFSRGKPGEPEDTYTCAIRLAEEVGWRFFIVGKRDIYFVNDNDLLKAEPRYTITPETEGLVEDPTFDVEAGNRRVIEGGRKVLKSSEGTLNVRADRYAAPPGTVIELEDWGPADGKWLVDTPERSLFDAGTTIHIRTPQKPLEEPKATQSTTPEVGTAGTGELAAEGGAGTAASRAIEKRLATEHPELQLGVRKVVATILTQFPEMSISSTTGGTHATHSLHYEGRAADLVGGNMDAIGTWIAQNLTSRLTEGIHNGTLSVSHGQHVDPSFWGAAVWAEHVSHIHVGV